MGGMTAYLPRLYKSPWTSGAMPQTKEAILLWVAWCIGEFENQAINSSHRHIRPSAPKWEAAFCGNSNDLPLLERLGSQKLDAFTGGSGGMFVNGKESVKVFGTPEEADEHITSTALIKSLIISPSRGSLSRAKNPPDSLRQSTNHPPLWRRKKMTPPNWPEESPPVSWNFAEC